MPPRAMHLRRSVGKSALACTASRSISPSRSELTRQAYAWGVIFSARDDSQRVPLGKRLPLLMTAKGHCFGTVDHFLATVIAFLPSDSRIVLTLSLVLRNEERPGLL